MAESHDPMPNIVRHYGSCGHIVDTADDRLFEKFAAPHYHQSLTDKAPVLVQNEVTEENGVKVVHVHPYRYCPCHNCCLAELESDNVASSP